MEPEPTQQLQRWGIRSELRVIIPVVNCFSVCEFGESFTSHWLRDPVIAFWCPMIFLFQGSYLTLGYRDVN
jgi:hypothetical protein